MTNSPKAAIASKICKRAASSRIERVALRPAPKHARASESEAQVKASLVHRPVAKRRHGTKRELKQAVR
jgi:hypothetical protein